MKHLLTLLFSLFTISLFAQETGEPLISLLGSPMESKEIQAWLGAKDDCEMDDDAANEVIAYSCPKKGIQIEAENGILTWIMVFAEGADYDDTKWTGYKGALPYGLKMGMTRKEVENILGKPEPAVSNEDPEESSQTDEIAFYPERNITVHYNAVLDKAGHGTPGDKIMGIVVD
jgi:hypothetical protein